jgi:hypothetical protein
VTELCAPVCDRVVCVTMLCDAKDRARHQRQHGAASATPATKATPMTPSATPATPKTVATQGLVCDKIVCV